MCDNLWVDVWGEGCMFWRASRKSRRTQNEHTALIIREFCFLLFCFILMLELIISFFYGAQHLVLEVLGHTSPSHVSSISFLELNSFFAPKNRKIDYLSITQFRFWCCCCRRRRRLQHFLLFSFCRSGSGLSSMTGLCIIINAANIPIYLYASVDAMRRVQNQKDSCCNNVQWRPAKKRKLPPMNEWNAKPRRQHSVWRSFGDFYHNFCA